MIITESKEINDLKNFISGYYISDDLCDEIAKLFSNKYRTKFNGTFKNDFRGYIYQHLGNLSKDIDIEYKKQIQSMVDLYSEQYDFFKILKENSELEANNIKMQWYDPKSYYSVLHCENYGHKLNDYNRRILVFLTYINTIEDGGGTEFPFQNMKIKAEKGLTLLWPPYWTHPHRGIVSNTEKKFILTGWYTTTH